MKFFNYIALAVFFSIGKEAFSSEPNSQRKVTNFTLYLTPLALSPQEKSNISSEIQELFKGKNVSIDSVLKRRIKKKYDDSSKELSFNFQVEVALNQEQVSLTLDENCTFDAKNQPCMIAARIEELQHNS